MTRLRLRSPEFGTSRCEWLEASDPAVLAHCCHGEESRILAVHNLSGRDVETTVQLGFELEALFDVLKNCDVQVKRAGPQRFRLPPYGYLWMRADRRPESSAGASGRRD
jgi:hypothetical protein